MNIAYISWCYGKNRDGNLLHLVRLKSGSGILFTSDEMVKLGLATW
jgi:hypothetical protein